MGAPEASEGRDGLQRVGDAPVLEAPVECCPNVVELVLGPLQPPRLLGTSEPFLCLLRKREEAVCVQASAVVERPGGGKASDCVLADGLEHRKPHRAVADILPQQAPRDEGLEVGEDPLGRTGDRPRVVERAAPGEDGEQAVEPPLALARQRRSAARSVA